MFTFPIGVRGFRLWQS